MSTIILAGSVTEHNRFAAQEGVRGSWHAANCDKLKGIRPSVVHILPGYWKRRDLHACEAQMRHARRRTSPREVRWVEVSGKKFVVEQPELPETAPIPDTALSSVESTDLTADEVVAEASAADLPIELAEPSAEDIDDFLAMIDGES